MKRLILIVLSLGVCGVIISAVLTQRNQLTELRAEQSRVLERQTAAENQAAVSTTVEQNVTQKSHSPSLELLKLRGEVGRLSSRKRELAGVTAEREHIQGQGDSSNTNVAGADPLPPDYIKKFDAKFVGYNSPEDTIQSLLWAMQNRDVSVLLNSYEPTTAKKIEEIFQKQSSVETLFKSADAIPGMHILGKVDGTETSGEVVLMVKIMPGQEPQQLRFKQIGGQWKMASGF